jgi:hypothetical protein
MTFEKIEMQGKYANKLKKENLAHRSSWLPSLYLDLGAQTTRVMDRAVPVVG